MTNFKKSSNMSPSSVTDNNHQCSCSCSKNTTPELLKKISKRLLASTETDRNPATKINSKIRRSSRARRHLEFPAEPDNTDDGYQDGGSLIDHWQGVGRDLRNLADSLADMDMTIEAPVPGHMKSHLDWSSLDFSSPSNIIYSFIMILLLRKVASICRLK